VNVFRALKAASAAGVQVKLQGGKVMVGFWREREPPEAVIDLLRTCESALVTLMSAREAAMQAIGADRPPDCDPRKWRAAIEGARRFVADGWSDRAALMGWTADELYRVPPVWSRIDLCGAALIIGDSHLVAVTEASVVIETHRGSRLKFRHIGREHLA
jgi:hypothetical protein